MKLDDAAASAGDCTLQSHDHKFIYLCFETHGVGGPCKCKYEVYAIKLADLICDRCSSGCASQSKSKLGSPWKSIAGYSDSGSGVYGSSIVVAGVTTSMFKEAGILTSTISVRDVFTVETSDRKESTRPGIRPFRVGKCRPIMVEMGGKLYALPDAQFNYMHPMDLNNSFEVYDFKTARWSLLPPPPYLSLDLWEMRELPTGFCVAVAGTSILVSCGPSFSFNTCTEEWAELRIPSSDIGAAYSNGRVEIPYRELSGAPCSDAIGDNPFVSCGRNLVIDHFMLAYDCAQPWTVSVFRICGEHSEFNFRLLQKLKLPQDTFPPEFCPDGTNWSILEAK